ncbi:hypothetical protein [uncultured Aquimarina sp.]|uniref:hypothetical protein n=1 Tax=uncultured Aquimarina sp. TaxID=575652 RepID=UPI00260C8F39|nr:hypothetical protein [uncultured Aquimarina sp.]
MIAGETEMLLADHLGEDAYDEFLFFGNKEKRAKRRAARKARRAKRRSDPKRIARRQIRRNFFSKLGQAYRDLGGGAAIGGAIDTMVRRPSTIPNSNEFPIQQTGAPSDFSVGIGENQQNVPEKKDSSNILLIVGGLVVVGGIVGLMIYQSNKNKYISVNQG